MKLHRLSLQAFGPFADPHPTVVNFDELGKVGIFSISGATGSGKSTLLDAICFALYGQTTGGERSPEDMRSQHAPPTLTTFVELEFSLRDGDQRPRYRYRREPEQTVAGKRSSSTRSPHKIAIHELDEKGRELKLLASQVRAAQDVTARLLHLSVEQFRKVIILPQGQFSEILRDRLSDQRTAQWDLFDLLFDTGWTKDLVESIKQQKRTGEAQTKSLDEQRAAIFRQVGVATPGELAELSRHLARRVGRAQLRESQVSEESGRREQALQYGRRIQEILAARDRAQSELQALESEIPIRTAESKVLNLGQAAARVTPFMIALRQAEEALKHEEQAADHAQKQWQAAAEQLAEASTLAQQIPDLEQQRENRRYEKEALDRTLLQFDQVEKQIRLWEQAKLGSANAHRTYAEQEARVVALATEMEHLEQKHTAFQVRAADIAEVRAQDQQLQGLKQTAQRWRKLDRDRAKLAEELQVHAETRLQVQTQRVEAEQHYRDRTQAFLNGQSVELARHLLPGEPCPVCGSPEHPAPALPLGASTVPTRGELDQAAEAVERIRQQEQQAEEKFQDCQTRLTTLDAARSEARLALGEWAERLDDLDSRLGQMKAQLQAWELAEREAGTIQERLNHLRIQRPLVAAETEKARTQWEAAKNRDAAAQATLTTLQSQLPPGMNDAAQARRQRDELELQLRELEGQLTQRTSQLQRARELHASASAAMAATRDSVQQRTQERQNALQIAKDHLAREGFVRPDGSPDIEAARAAWIAPDELDSRLQSWKRWESALALARNQRDRTALEAADHGPPPLDHLERLRDRALGILRRVSQRVGGLQRRQMEFHQAEQRWTALEATAAGVLQSQQGWCLLDDLFREGKVPGTAVQIPPFREYVLGASLARGVQRANIRFRRMTQGRYELRQQGLELPTQPPGGSSIFPTPRLLIHDLYLQTQRPVSTLSGGETFQLALALALGLADTITEAQGGIQLDTVFIDEGFGTLDQESLDQAIGVLTELRDSGRTVGVISHVEEIHQRMPARLRVIRDSDGRSRLASSS